jgi:HAMP domain-containing protein
MRSVKAGVIYFLLLFAVGWVLGPIRELLAVRHFGRMAATLSVAVIMLIAMIVAARWVIRRVSRASNAPYDDLDRYSCDRIFAPG